MEQVIELEALEKRFPSLQKPAVASLTTRLTSGAVTGLVGPDGAGKTTLLRMLAGLLKPSS
jgi:ABC-2 type transport system ATP-binding protein